MILDWFKDKVETFLTGRKKKKRKGARRKRGKSRRKQVRRKRFVKTKKRKGGIPKKRSLPRKSPARKVTRVKITKPISMRPRVSSPTPNQVRITPRPSAKKGSGKLRGDSAPKEKIALRPGKRIGAVTHYFDKINVGVLKADLPLKIGDAIEIRRKGLVAGKEIISSMQVNHNPIKRAKRGDEIGLKLKTLSQKGDELYKL